MISQKESQLVRALHRKKHREKEGLFSVEGVKPVQELLKSSYHAQLVFTTDESLFPEEKKTEVRVIREKEMKKISAFKTPSPALAIAAKPSSPAFLENGEDQLLLALDSINDPGNLGTILRTADHFGIRTVLCSKGSVDPFNPKVVQASMGSLFRVNVINTTLEQTLNDLNIPVFATAMNGENIYQANLPEYGVILMGSESHGLSPALSGSASRCLSIPSFGKAESLNVAVATAIVCSEFRRRSFP